MRTLPMLGGAALALLAACASTRHFGAPVPGGEALAALTVLNHPDVYDGKSVIVRGTIAEVCQVKGCWMIVREGHKEMRVTFKDYAFFLPKDSAGATVRIEGLFAIRDVPADEARHYLEDAGRHAEAAKIVGPVRELTLVASGVAFVES